MATIFPSVEPLCDRCGLRPATLGHMFWGCPKLSNYWDNIFRTLSNILHRPINLDPLVAVLGIIDSSMTKSNTEHNIVSYVILLARRLILLNWKQKVAPTYSNLLTDIMRHLELEKMRFMLKNQERMFYRIWQLFIDYFNHIT